jgi:hypothetical protein
MPTRFGVARGVAALALTATLVGSAAVPGAFAAEPAAAVSVQKKKDPEESPSNPSSASSLLNLPGTSSSSKGKGDLADSILTGIHFAADAADFVVPVVVDLLDGGN